MADIVFIFGAGASVDAGVPLMAGFLRNSEALYRDSGRIPPEDRAAFESVYSARGKLSQAHAKSNLDLDNIEAIYSAIHMAHVLGISNLFDEPTEDVLSSVRRLLVSTIENSPEFHWDVGHKAANPPRPYDYFAKQLKRAINDNPKRSISIITFNYDVGLEYALVQAGLDIDYAFEKTGKMNIPVMKLHGSTNWSICPNCQTVEVSPVQQYPFRKGLKSGTVFMSHAGLGITTGKCQEAGCCQSTREPFIVPPTWNKGNDYEPIRAVWQRAASELASARQVCVVGYSLPSTDIFFHYLFGLGTTSDTYLEKFLVYDPASLDITEKRFFPLLSSPIRTCFEHRGLKFRHAIRDIEESVSRNRQINLMWDNIRSKSAFAEVQHY